MSAKCWDYFTPSPLSEFGSDLYVYHRIHATSSLSFSVTLPPPSDADIISGSSLICWLFFCHFGNWHPRPTHLCSLLSRPIRWRRRQRQTSFGRWNLYDEVSERHLLFSLDCVAAIALKIPIDSRQPGRWRSQQK